MRSTDTAPIPMERYWNSSAQSHRDALSFFRFSERPAVLPNPYLNDICKVPAARRRKSSPRRSPAVPRELYLNNNSWSQGANNSIQHQRTRKSNDCHAPTLASKIQLPPTDQLHTGKTASTNSDSLYPSSHKSSTLLANRYETLNSQNQELRTA